MVGVAGVSTPLCPAGHLPHKGGDWLDASASPSHQRFIASGGIYYLGLSARHRYYLISPLVGEMPGRAEGGVVAAPAITAAKEHAMPHAPVPPQRRANAKRMRKAMTDAELKLWNELRAHRLTGLSFRRQQPIAGYIVGFACPEHRLIVEIDGSQHANPDDAAYDAGRTRRLEADGWIVLRFWNGDVLGDIDNVCLHIVTVIGKGHA